jgi:uncharacterized membrane protein YhiD involved in acid resistance
MKIKIIGWLLIIAGTVLAVASIGQACIGDADPIRIPAQIALGVVFGCTGWRLKRIPLPQK